MAVESITGQTLHDWELLIVDDHSADTAISRLSINDSRLKVIASEGEGIVAALNTGLKHARGDFVARMDADDQSLPERLQCQLDFQLEHPEIDIVGCRVEIFGDGPLEGGFRRYQDWLNSLISADQISKQIFIESPMPHPSWFMRSELMKSLGGYADPAWAEDYDLLLRADSQGLRMAKPESVLLRWRDHDKRLTRTDSRYSLENFLAAKIFYLAKSLSLLQKLA